MPIVNEDLISRLLTRPEGTKLDFKEKQYKLTDPQYPPSYSKEDKERDKSECVKDIVAMANTQGEEPAYIIIGVRKESSTPGAVPVGLDMQLDDNIFQNIIGSLVNPVPLFQYEEIRYKDYLLGVLSIFCHGRKPHFINKDFGKISESCVYIRQGSKTKIAQPDEIESLYTERLRTAELQLTQNYVASLLTAELKRLEPQISISWKSGGENSDSLYRDVEFCNKGAYAVHVFQLCWEFSLKNDPSAIAYASVPFELRLLRDIAIRKKIALLAKVVSKNLGIAKDPRIWRSIDVRAIFSYKGADDVVHQYTLSIT